MEDIQGLLKQLGAEELRAKREVKHTEINLVFHSTFSLGICWSVNLIESRSSKVNSLITKIEALGPPRGMGWVRPSKDFKLPVEIMNGLHIRSEGEVEIAQLLQWLKPYFKQAQTKMKQGDLPVSKHVTEERKFNFLWKKITEFRASN